VASFSCSFPNCSFSTYKKLFAGIHAETMRFVRIGKVAQILAEVRRVD
jgi:hypothetical protein